MEAETKIILLVDDDADDRSFFCEALRQSGEAYFALQAENGVEALEKLEHLKKTDNLPCLIILDLNMPLMDGRTALKRIRKDIAYDNVPIAIFTTTRPLDAEDLVLFYKINVIEKPMQMKKTIEIIQKLLVNSVS